jgi:hypothetical protein
MIELTASRILYSLRCPETDRTMFLSAVNILLGRIKLSTGRLPEIKSCVSYKKGIITTSPFTNLPMPHPVSPMRKI